ncbi:porin family protein [Roseateles sp. 22389]|uniref:porin family protein n=1 Tax=Roseateles sp. 22389 TaxID=3453916 RepID=UPI003F829174
MTKISAIVVAALLAAGAAQAQTQTQAPLYGELGYTFVKVKADGGLSAKPGAIRGIVGYDVHPNVAIEGMLAFGVSDDTVGGAKIKIPHSYGLFVTPKYAFDQFEVFGRLGYAHSKIKASDEDGSISDSGGSFAYGLGAKYNFDKSIYGAVDYMRYYKKDGIKADGFTLSVGYRF